MALNRAERRRQEKLAKKQGKTISGSNGSSNAALDALMADAHAKYKDGKLPETLKLLESVLEIDSNRQDVAGTAGMIALDLEDYEKAVQHYTTAVTLEPNNMKAQFGLGLAYKTLGQFDKAEDPLKKSVELSDGALEPTRLLVDILWQLEKTIEIPIFAKQLLKHEPHKTIHAMHEALSHYHRGTPEKARALLGFNELVEIHDLEPPEGYDTMKAFNQALADYVVDHPSMAVPDESDPKYHNEHLHITRELTGPQAEKVGEPMKTLEAMIAAKVEGYVTSRVGKLDHPFINRWPKKSHLVSWGTLLKGQGNLVPHIHIDGYLGMVYYPELPETMGADNDGSSGYLELGRPPEDFPVELETDVHLIEPKEGRLIIFPGYFFHNTVPFTAEGRRISIAFDVVAG